MSPARCAEPVRLKNRKLKQVDPELLCKEPDPVGDPTDKETDLTEPIEPSSIRGKQDATTLCHTYIFPQIRMDCSNRGKLTIRIRFHSVNSLINSTLRCASLCLE